MRICAISRVALVAAFWCYALPASAQLFESIGTRAQGMGGAFVGVADDATASWWNPAGLATGSYFNVVIEKGALTQPSTPGALDPAQRTGGTGFAAAFPALGISSYRLQVVDVRPISPTDSSVAGRQQQAEGRHVRRLSIGLFGATVGQSIGDHLVIGSTLKVVRGNVASADIDATGDGLDRASDLDGESQTHGDLDVGAMARFGMVKLGATVRNLTRPSFGVGNDRRTLERQARTGLSVTGRQAGFDSVTVAVDTDLTRTDTVFGEVRHAAAGAEVWLRGKRFGFRGGATTNTVGERRRSFSTGVSVAPIKGVFIEASKTTGSDASLSGWTSNLRFAF